MSQPPGMGNYLQFETGTTCNADCTFCMHGCMKRHGIMPLTKIIDLTYHLAHKAHVICPFHMQEPLLDSRIDKICSNVKVFNPKSKVWVYTNMSLYPQKQLENIVKWGLVDGLIVSLYGRSPEQHNSMQRGIDYEACCENLKRFRKMRDGFGYSLPEIRVGYLVTKETMHGIKQFMQDWHGIADETVFFRYDGWCGNLPYDPDFEAKLWGPPAPRVPCKELWAGPTVHFDGTLVPCCMDYDDSMPLGNIFKDWTLWEKGVEINKLRRLHTEGRWDEVAMCRNCTKWRYNHEKEWIEYWLRMKKSVVCAVKS